MARGFCCVPQLYGEDRHDAECTRDGKLFDGNSPTSWVKPMSAAQAYEDEPQSRLEAWAGFIGATVPATLFFTVVLFLSELLFAAHVNLWLPLPIAWCMTVGLMLSRRD